MRVHLKGSLAIAAGMLLALGGAGPARAGVGDTLTYLFNAEATGSFTVGVTQATLVLTETASGVDFVLSPNWGVTTAKNVERLQFAFSGEPVTFAYLGGAEIDSGASQFGAHAGSFDASYSTPAYYQIEWFNPSAKKFDSGKPSSSWSLNGTGITLADFSIAATTSNVNKPSPIFGVISMPGAAPNNWVAAAVPEPQAYALAVAGMLIVGCAMRRKA